MCHSLGVRIHDGIGSQGWLGNEVCEKKKRRVCEKKKNVECVKNAWIRVWKRVWKTKNVVCEKKTSFA